jgi:hypothetical protein
MSFSPLLQPIKDLSSLSGVPGLNVALELSTADVPTVYILRLMQPCYSPPDLPDPRECQTLPCMFSCVSLATVNIIGSLSPQQQCRDLSNRCVNLMLALRDSSTGLEGLKATELADEVEK